MSPMSTSYMLWFVLAGMLFVSQCYGDPPISGSRGPRFRPRPGIMRQFGGLRPDLLVAYSNALEETTPGTRSPWESYTPQVPNPDEVECQIHIPTVRTIGGRCVQLGGRNQPFACQSGPHLEMQPTCVPQHSNQMQLPTK